MKKQVKGKTTRVKRFCFRFVSRMCRFYSGNLCECRHFWLLPWTLFSPWYPPLLLAHSGINRSGLLATPTLVNSFVFVHLDSVHFSQLKINCNGCFSCLPLICETQSGAQIKGIVVRTWHSRSIFPVKKKKEKKKAYFLVLMAFSVLKIKCKWSQRSIISKFSEKCFEKKKKKTLNFWHCLWYKSIFY